MKVFASICRWKLELVRHGHLFLLEAPAGYPNKNSNSPNLPRTQRGLTRPQSSSRNARGESRGWWDHNSRATEERQRERERDDCGRVSKEATEEKKSHSHSVNIRPQFVFLSLVSVISQTPMPVVTWTSFLYFNGSWVEESSPYPERVNIHFLTKRGEPFTWGNK